MLSFLVIELFEKKSETNIKEIVGLILGEFGFLEKEYFFITDSASNMISACDDKERYS